MSVYVTSWVWREAPVAGNELLVLLAMADIANDDGVCWPGNQHLAAKTRLSVATVKRMTAQLRSQGIVVADVSLGRRNTFRIVMQTGLNLNPAQSAPGAQVSRGSAHSYEPGVGSPLSHRTISDTSVHTTPGSNIFDSSEFDAASEPVEFELDVPQGTRAKQPFPREFEVSHAMRVWAHGTAPSVDVDKATREFIAYWREGEGKGIKRKNWKLTWMNRIEALHARNLEHGWKASEEKPRVRNGQVVR